MVAAQSAAAAAAAALSERLDLGDAVESSSDILLDTREEPNLPSREPPDIYIGPAHQAISLPDQTAVSLSNALRDIVHERELAVEMRPILQSVIDNAAQAGVQAQDSVAWQLAGQHLPFACQCCSQQL